MWRESVRSAVPGARLAKAATVRSIRSVERALAVSLPADLQALLRETNGVVTASGLEIVWGAGEIIDRNRGMRELQTEDGLYRPFDSLLFFGEAGNGDLFGYRLDDGAEEGQPILGWDHETDERLPLAADLQACLRLLGSEEGEEDEGSGEPAEIRRLVSIWVGTHESEEAFGTYLADGFLYAACRDSEGLSRFDVDAGLQPDDFMGVIQRWPSRQAASPWPISWRACQARRASRTRSRSPHAATGSSARQRQSFCMDFATTRTRDRTQPPAR
jgi:hypothetical protein